MIAERGTGKSHQVGSPQPEARQTRRSAARNPAFFYAAGGNNNSFGIFTAEDGTREADDNHRGSVVGVLPVRAGFACRYTPGGLASLVRPTFRGRQNRKEKRKLAPFLPHLASVIMCDTIGAIIINN